MPHGGQRRLPEAALCGVGLMDYWLSVSLLLAAAGAGTAGLLVGMPAIRVSGLHLAMVTMAFAIVTEHVLGRWKSVTAGHSGLPVPDPAIFGFSLGGPRPFYFVCLVVLVLALLLLVNLMRSATGRAFIGIRDSEAAAQGLGIDVARTKVIAFSLSAGISGLAGALLAHQMQHITPEAFGLALSLQLVLMVFIGGLGSLRGAILGAVLIGLLPSFISALKDALPARVGAQFGLELFVYGAVLTFFVLLEPGGLNARWVRIRKVLGEFPWVRTSSIHRTKVYMKSERYR